MQLFSAELDPTYSVHTHTSRSWQYCAIIRMPQLQLTHQRDTLCSSICLQRLTLLHQLDHTFGVRGTTHKWINSYLDGEISLSGLAIALLNQFRVNSASCKAVYWDLCYLLFIPSLSLSMLIMTSMLMTLSYTACPEKNEPPKYFCISK